MTAKPSRKQAVRERDAYARQLEHERQTHAHNERMLLRAMGMLAMKAAVRAAEAGYLRRAHRPAEVPWVVGR